MFKRMAPLAIALALFALACGNKTTSSTTTATTAGGGSSSSTSAGGASSTTAAGGANAYSVQVDDTNKDSPVALLQFFPDKLTVHGGDTVKFKLANAGEPHTVTFGALVDKGFAAQQKAGGGPRADEVPELAKALPDLLPDLSKEPTANPDARQYAAQPCFLDSGTPPTAGDTPCPKATQPAFSGKQALYNSGWLAKDAEFPLKLADDIAPGEYNWFCLLHRSDMAGKLTVVAKSAKAQTPDEVKAAGQDAIAKQIGFLKDTAAQMQSSPLGGLQAGGINFTSEESHGLVTQFGPKSKSAKVGEAVTWYLVGVHTVSINPGEDAKTTRVQAADGSVHFNRLAALPQNSAGQPPPQPPPSTEPSAAGSSAPSQAGPPPPPDPSQAVVIDGGTYDGTGFKSSGVILSFGEPLFAYKVTFSKAGTYKYFCLVHSDMEGSLTVA